MPITRVQFQRGCVWCDKPLETEEDQLLVTIGHPGEAPTTFYAHAACFVASLAPRARELWANIPRLSMGEGGSDAS